ncbi:periplasmic heavy metal sensor [Niveispirillum irakense]|uniref:periplasmic heavy metal sensor n=1 Tax=Niveispirillum irakense TaxID=34011 RepID=UPI00042090BA|nr:periplasmic heavy metal sensor [Niveispirillum irakense]
MSNSRILQTVLLASVGLNLFLLGVMVPGWLGHRGGPPPMDRNGPGGPVHGGMPGPGPGPMGSAFMLFHQAAERLPPADAALLRDHLEKVPDQMRERIDQMGSHIEKVRQLMQADPFDADALTAALTEMADWRAAEDKEQMAGLSAIMAQMSPEGRRILAEIRMPPLRSEARRGAIPFDRERGPMAGPPPAGPPPEKGPGPGPDAN